MEATHCIALQHTATRYNTLYHTAPHFARPQHTATQKNTFKSRRPVLSVIQDTWFHDSLICAPQYHDS